MVRPKGKEGQTGDRRGAGPFVCSEPEGTEEKTVERRQILLFEVKCQGPEEGTMVFFAQNTTGIPLLISLFSVVHKKKEIGVMISLQMLFSSFLYRACISKPLTYCLLGEFYIRSTTKCVCQ